MWEKLPKAIHDMPVFSGKIFGGFRLPFVKFLYVLIARCDSLTNIAFPARIYFAFCLLKLAPFATRILRLSFDSFCYVLNSIFSETTLRFLKPRVPGGL